MFVLERIQRIKQVLYEQDHIDVATLSEILGVSDVTIRRDLERLEKDGFLTRTYGGASINPKYVETKSATEIPDDSNSDDIKLVASIASQFIRNNEAIFLGSGAICLQIARNIKGNRSLTVVTNDILVACELMHSEGIKVVVTGGELSSTSSATVGPLAEQFLHNINVGKAFIGVTGISTDRGFSTYDFNEALVYRFLFSAVREIIVVADESAYDQTDFAFIAALKSASKVISNNTSDEYKKFFFENDIKFYSTHNLD